MTGAGSATVAWAPEDEYGEAADPEEDTWRQPGVDVEVGDASLENALERTRHPDDPTPARSREGQFEGALDISFSMTDDHWHELVFADDGEALPTGSMAAPSSTWYLGADLVDGSEPRTPTGATVVDASINYNQGEDVTIELSLLFGDEPDDIGEPATIEQPSASEVFTWHGVGLDIDNLGQELMQTATLSLSNLARFRRGQSRHPFDAVVDAIEPSFSSDAILTERDQLELAYGGTTPSDTVDDVDGTFSLENGEAEMVEYVMKGMQPTSYSWNDLVNADEDLTESIEYHVAMVEVA